MSRNLHRTVARMLALWVLLGPALTTAHVESYTNPNPGLGASIRITDCHPLPVRVTEENIGGFCYPAGHTIPDEGLGAWARIEDGGLALDPVSGAYCQDLDGDDICGEACFDCFEPNLYSEPRFSFCQTAVLGLASFRDFFPKAAADWREGPNWFGDADVEIRVAGPLAGNAVLNPGGCPTPVSFSMSGFGDHS